MRFKTLPIFTLATYHMGSNFSIRVTPNINLTTVGLISLTHHIHNVLLYYFREIIAIRETRKFQYQGR